MELFQEKLIRGSVHPYTGMEAIAVGVCSALGEQRLHHLDAPRPRTLDREGPRPEADDGRDHRPRHRLLRRQGRQHAHHRDAPRHARRRRDRRRLGRDRNRRGVRPAPAGEGRRRRLVLRRRRVEPGHLPRGGEPGLGPRRAGDLRLREQPVGDLDAVPGRGQRAGHRRPGERLRLSGRGRRRQRLLRRPRGGGAGGRARPRRRRADADRGEVVPDHAALGRDAERQPAAGGARALALARPDRPLRRRRSSSGSSSPRSGSPSSRRRRSARWRRRPTSRSARRFRLPRRR